MIPKMPRNPPVQQVYIAEGFADDCEELIHRCSRVDQLNYPTFCSHYKEMNFATVYQFRSTNAEIGELSEELLQIAKHYMVRDTSNFEESVAGLFIVYALLNLQPFPRFAALRLVQDDLPALERLERVSRRDNRLDVLYVLANVLVRGPVQFHADARPRGMEAAFRNNLEGFCNLGSHGVRPKGVYSRQNEELDLLRDMTSIVERYNKARSLIPGFQKADENSNLAVELGNSLKRVIHGITDDAEEESSVPDHHDAIQEIKKRAMRNAVSTVRHLDSAALRNIQKSPSRKEEKGKGAKPKTPKKSPKTKLKYSSSSEEEGDDEDIEILAKDVMSHASFRDIINDKDTHINIDSLPRIHTTESDGRLFEIEIIDEMEIPYPPIISDTDGKIEIEITDPVKNAIPPSGELIEIEILDQVKNQNDFIAPLVSKEHVDKVIEDKGESKAKKKGRPKKNECTKSEAKKQDDERIFKKPLRTSPRLKQVLKRDQKKPILKSKFKRMGLLEVANFQDKK